MAVAKKVITIKMRADAPQINFYTLTPSFNKKKCKQYFILFNTDLYYKNDAQSFFPIMHFCIGKM